MDTLTREWSVIVETAVETDTSVCAFGTRRDQPVVLKVVKREGDEWRSGVVVAAFQGSGVVRADEHVDGAALLERAEPGTPLTGLAIAGRDEAATAILAGVIERLRGHRPPAWCPTVHDWAKGFDAYLAGSDDRIPRELVREAALAYARLAASQSETMLLHGDLQHDNVLQDARRGWLAIDPKGVIGEIEFEIGAALRNPVVAPDLFAARKTIERRLHQLSHLLNLDADRARQWSFAQAVLSVVWRVEDGFRVDEADPVLALARTLRDM